LREAKASFNWAILLSNSWADMSGSRSMSTFGAAGTGFGALLGSIAALDSNVTLEFKLALCPTFWLSSRAGLETDSIAMIPSY
jgi:hypothetical protein